jgi:AcrR family transcriptional regulator
MTRPSESADAASQHAPAAAAARGRKGQPDAVQSDILAVATEEFASRGLSGARVDAIAEKTRTTKGMIYYYFGSKEGLYIAVLERAYLSIRSAEQGDRIASLPPLEGARALVEASFDFHTSHPHVGRLISIENIHLAKYARQAPRIAEENQIAITTWAAILSAGQRDGIFRNDVEAIDMHAFVSSLCLFPTTNRYTFSALFKLDFDDPAVRKRHRHLVVDMVLDFLRGPSSAGTEGAS